MKDLRIDNKWQRVFVMTENEERIVYVPIKSLHRVDYDRLTKAEKDKPKSMALMDYLAKQKFSNGRNALAQLDSIMQVANKATETQAKRVRKPNEPAVVEEEKDVIVVERRSTPKEEKVNESNKNVEHKVDVGLSSLSGQKNAQDTEYVYTDKNGKKKFWSGQGRVPNVIKEHIDSGGDMEDFRV